MLIRSVLLDLDGTLVDTNPSHAESYLRAFADFGYAVDLPSIEHQVGKGGDRLVPALIGEEAALQHGTAIRARAASIFSRLLAPSRRFSLLRGAEALVEELRARGVPTAIATSSDVEFLDAIFQNAQVDLRDRVDVVTTNAAAGASKPAGDVLSVALDELGRPADTAVLIGDTVYDIEAAARAGVLAVGVSTWVWDDRALREAGAALTFRDPEDVLEHLDEVLELSQRVDA